MLAIYTRLSQQDDSSNSIENQIKEGKEFANKLKLEYKIFNEGEGVKGTDALQDRPILKSLIDEIIDGTITKVWFRNQNRLERSSLTFHMFSDIVKKNRVEVYFGDNKEDWNDPNTFLKSSILTVLNSYQVSLQSTQTKKALRNNIKEGKAHGVLPYGYSTDKNGFLIIDDEEEKIVKEIYELSLNGVGTRSIAGILNERNVPTRYNKLGSGTLTTKNKFTGKETTIRKKDIKWSGNSIRGILTNKIYFGEKHWKGEIYKAPSIIEKQYWEKVNNNLKNNRNNTGKKVEHKYLLKGLLECGKCGRNMYGRTRVNKKDNYYMCSSKRIKDENCGNRSINIDFIEKYLWNTLFTEYKIKEDMIINNDINIDYKIDSLASIKQKLISEKKALESERQKLIRLNLKGVISDSELLSNKTSTESKLDDLVIRIKNIDEEISFEENNKALNNNIKDDLIDIKNNTPFNKKKEYLKKYIKRVIVFYNENEKIYFLKIRYKTLKESVHPIIIKPKDFRNYVQTGKFSITLSLDELDRVVDLSNKY